MAAVYTLDFLLIRPFVTMDRRSDIPMGRPREGPAVSHKVYVAYLKKEKQRLKREKAEPKVIRPRNFSKGQIRKDLEAKSKGTFSREIFRANSSGEPSEGL